MDSNIDQLPKSGKDFEYEDCRELTDIESASWLLDDGPVLKTTFMVYDRLFADGQREICASKFVQIKGATPSIGKAKRGESEKKESNVQDSAKRAKQAVRLRCKAISADRMITLTYRENMRDMDRLKKHWDLFRRRMSKHKQFHYVATIETQQRGAYHIHVAVRGRQIYSLIRSIWQSIVGLTQDGKQAAQINVRDPHKFGFGKNGAHRLASYIAKYIAKDVDSHELNKKSYWTSRGIVVPEKNYYQLPYGTNTYEAFCHVMQLAADHNGEGMTYFGNDALGVCWVATAPVTMS